MKTLSIAWRFSRPHTIIGSTISTMSLFIMASHAAGWPPIDMALLLFTLGSALACNLYIVGLNQIADLEIDRQNKPNLPLASGELRMSAAMRVVAISGILSIVFGLAAGWPMLVLVVAIGALGTAYSLPPLKFKKNHFMAALSITLVRGVLVNIVMYLHFQWAMMADAKFPFCLTPLILLMILFSVGIAWFKDIPDITGDEAFEIRTIPVRRGARWAFGGAVSLVSLAYLTLILWAGVGLKGYDTSLMAIWHALALAVFWLIAYKTNPYDKRSVTYFYRAYWGLFFLEYIVYPFGLI